MRRGSWVLVLACLLLVGAGLAWADAALLHPFLPDAHGPREGGFRPRPGGSPLMPFAGFGSFGRDRGAFGYGWLLSTAAVLALAATIAAALVPGRVRVAVERLEAPGGPGAVLVAGAVGAVLLGASTLLLRYTFVLVGLAPLLWLLAVAAVTFGTAALGVYAGRRLRSIAGTAPALLVTLTGIVLVIDLALVPWAGWVFALVAAAAALGLAVLTRFGSPDGWSLDALNWPVSNS